MLQTAALLLAALLWGYCLASAAFPGAATLLALLQTNPAESMEYLQTNFTPLTLLFFALFCCAYAFLLYRLLVKLTLKRCCCQYPVLLLALGLLLNILAFHLGTDNFLTNIYREAQTALHSYDNFKEQKEQRQQALAGLGALQQTAAPGVYVLVIGESQNKNHMSAYGYHRDTTPWLTSMRGQKNFFLLQNAYACHSHTVPVLTYALTAKNQYNTVPLEQAPSIVEVANAAGFHTVWISNQVRYSAWDTPISVIAAQAHQQYWLNEHLGETTATTQYDLSLVDTVKKLPPAEKMLIVVHLMGNHGAYDQRYPREFNKWPPASKSTAAVAEYDNSIFYNDYVMQQLVSYLQQLPNFQGLVYFADHADDVDAGLAHDSSKFTFNMVRIPVYLYFSPAYAKKQPQLLANLQKHTSAYFTNDLIFDTMVEVLQIPLPNLAAHNSLLNSQYRHTPADLKTLYGKKSLTEDSLIRKD